MDERRETGGSLVEILAVLATMALVVAASLPSVLELRDSQKTAAAARGIALRFQSLRWLAVARGRSHGWFFAQDERGWHWFEVVDGNGNGIRTSEVRDGTDPRRSGPHRLDPRLGGVRLGFPGNGPFPAIPPRTGTLVDLSDPVKFGRAEIVAFTPRGRASSGTLYLTDGRDRLFGVRVFGPTARVRVWRWRRETGSWSR